MRRGTLLAGYLLLAGIAAVQQWSLQRPGDPYTHYNNYIIFRQAFVHLLQGQDLYGRYLAEHWDFFRYSPTFALAFGAFAWMPDLAGLLLWNALNASVLFLAWRTLPIRDERVQIAAGWFVAVELMTALQNAQSNALIAGLLILAFNSFERRRVALAALLIVGASFIKLFGVVAFSLVLLYPARKKFVAWCLLWTGAFAAAPLVVIAPMQLLGLYRSWWQLLSTDFADSAGLSVIGWLQSWFHLHPSTVVVDLAGIALFCWPLAYVPRHRDFRYRLLMLCNVLIWVVIFNHKAESSSYIIAISGVALWFFSGERRPLALILVSLAFVFTCLSPTDVFPRSLSVTFFVPYVVKAVPCILIWLKITYDLLSAEHRPSRFSRHAPGLLGTIEANPEGATR